MCSKPNCGRRSKEKPLMVDYGTVAKWLIGLVSQLTVQWIDIVDGSICEQ